MKPDEMRPLSAPRDTTAGIAGRWGGARRDRGVG